MKTQYLEVVHLNLMNNIMLKNLCLLKYQHCFVVNSLQQNEEK